ncbi:IS5 family transposase [Agrobacterium rhizogenes]|nr:IS5 family transposase [Rhizobium rhizogenes]NTJ77499.1 IS5 family transposase [Rhizobium rhizogenes]
MPFKHNASRRRRIGKMKFNVTNWAEYEAGLRRRGGQPRYSDLAIETALTLGLVFGSGLRQTQGLLVSVLKLMSLDLAVPDHTTLSRRASKRRLPNKRQDDRDRIPEKGAVHVLIDSTGLQTYGACQWLEEKHGTKLRRNWRKLNLALDADSGDIIAHVMTDQDAGDASQLEVLLDQIDTPVGQFTADGAYDGNPTYDAVTRRSAGAVVGIPPRAKAVERPDADPSSQRDRDIAASNTDCRMKWQVATGYGKRSLVETAIGCYKSIIGHRLRARSLGTQRTEVAIGCSVLNRMLACARPKSVRCKTATP